MNCDQAFERLTDPAASTDAGLVRHLEQCARCRAMQQTLSPALDWMTSASQDNFPESTRGWDRSGSPLLTEESVAIALEIARRQTRQGSFHAARRGLGIALVAMFGMALGVLVIGNPPESKHAPASNTLSPPVTACLWPRREGETLVPAENSQAVVDSCIACHVPAMLRN